MGGWIGRLLRVDLSNKSFQIEEIPKKTLLSYVGGRGLAARYYLDEVASRDIRPLGPENRLYIFAGAFVGTEVPGAVKTYIATKGPETGHYLITNAGGNFGPFLKRAGYDGVIIQGKAQNPTVLGIDKEKVFFFDAQSLWGLSTREGEQHMKEALSPPTASLSIGLAGERLVTFASVQSMDRSFGRGGAGAVMGSKNLKGIVVRAHDKTPVADPSGVAAARRVVVNKLREERSHLHRFGRNAIIDITESACILPTRNWTEGKFDGYSTLSSEYLSRKHPATHKTCYNCPISCSQVSQVPLDGFEGLTSDPEYETLWAYGPACGMADYGVILAANRLADDLGIDTMTSGQIIALMMDLYVRGYIDQSTLGINGSFGRRETLLYILKGIPTRKGIFDVLAGGFRTIKEALPGAPELAVEVKGMPPAGYDPRGVTGMALAYGTSNRGACHNVGGWTVRHELAAEGERFSTAGKAELVVNLQNTRSYVDCLGICTEVRRALGYAEEPMGEWFELVTGEYITKELKGIGERVYTTERLALVREGIDRKDDGIPLRYTVEPLKLIDGKEVAIPLDQYQDMLREYYTIRGWDDKGLPTSDTIRRLGIPDLDRRF